jgi:hypothetical protein
VLDTRPSLPPGSPVGRAVLGGRGRIGGVAPVLLGMDRRRVLPAVRPEAPHLEEDADKGKEATRAVRLESAVRFRTTYKAKKMNASAALFLEHETKGGWLRRQFEAL